MEISGDLGFPRLSREEAGGRVGAILSYITPHKLQMISQIYWIENFTSGRLGTMARPRGGEWLEDEVAAWKRAGVQVVASALTDEEMRELDILDEGILCKSHDIAFLRFPVTDRGLPTSMKEWASFIQSLSACLDEKKSVVAHCRMGIGRASMIAVSIMVSYGVEANDAFRWMTEARGLKVPDTDEQLYWISKFADAVRD